MSMLTNPALWITLVAPQPTGDQATDSTPPLVFERQVIDAKVEIGYGLAIADVDADGKDDILLADKREFAWYRNGDWKRQSLYKALTDRDNVCIAARRFGKSGSLEIGLGGDWGPNDTLRKGVARYLALGETPEVRYFDVELDADPTVHRMRFVDIRGSKGTKPRPGSEEMALVIAPLHGKGDVDGKGDPVKVWSYLPIEQFAFGFEKELVDASLHKTHNFDVGQWDPATTQEEIVLIGEEGARLCIRADGAWKSTSLPGVHGGGEIRMGRMRDGTRILATIEPMHGNVLALYREKSDHSFDRRELDTTLAEGHALALTDVDGDGEPEVVAGWRAPDAKGETGVRIYSIHEGTPSFRLDSKVACEDLKIGDFDHDGRPDIATAGRNSHDVVLFWNRTKRPGDTR